MSHWSGEEYDKIAAPVAAMVAPLLSDLDFSGCQTVVDLGCGSGRVSELLAERLPAGRLIAVDCDRSMLTVAHRRLGGFDNVTIVESDILDFDLGNEAADLVFSSAVFHWIKDHDLLFNNIWEMLADNGRLLAQCGGQDNVRSVLAAAEEVRVCRPYQDYFLYWRDPFNFTSPEASEARLYQAGFSEACCELIDLPLLPDNPRAYLREIILGHYLEVLPAELGQSFLDEVLRLLPPKVIIDYVRLNIDARR